MTRRGRHCEANHDHCAANKSTAELARKAGSSVAASDRANWWDY
jgi:hypothetical protein